MQDTLRIQRNVALSLSLLALVVAVVSLVYAFNVSNQTHRATEVGSADYYKSPPKPTDEQYAQSQYGGYMVAFEPFKNAGAAIKQTCAAIRKEFVNGISAQNGTGNFNPEPIQFDNPKDPLDAVSKYGDVNRCEVAGAYRQSYLADGDRDAGYGVTYAVHTPLSINASVDTADLKDNRSIRLYSRYNSAVYKDYRIAGPACSIQDGSRVTYMRTIPWRGTDSRGGHGSLVRYERPSKPVVDSEGSRYAGTKQCANGQLIVLYNLYPTQKTKFTLVK